jgi:hypothetical protein
VSGVYAAVLALVPNEHITVFSNIDVEFGASLLRFGHIHRALYESSKLFGIAMNFVEKHHRSVDLRTMRKVMIQLRFSLFKML